jgi:hypothetical protein
MDQAPGAPSVHDLEALALLETSLEQRVFEIAVRVGAALKGGGGLSSELLQEFRDAHADWQASRAVSEVAARRSPDWQLREQVGADLRREHIDTQHRLWLQQIQQADRGADRLTELVRVVARIAADIVMLADRTPPAEADVDARFAEVLAKRD